ncbi:MAG: hypothetical protein ABI839_08755 [Verrucomicrobiota bacterium]
MRRDSLSTKTAGLSVALLLCCVGWADAHPLGNFTINRFSRLQIADDRIEVRYVVDMAEIPAFQELQNLGATSARKPEPATLNTYLSRIAPQYANGLALTINDSPISLEVSSKNISFPPGAGNLPTLRVECNFIGRIPPHIGTGYLRFEDTNFRERIGWSEIAVGATGGISVFNSSVYGNSITDELKSYPGDMLSAPLNERAAELSWSLGPPPTGSHPLLQRDGRPIAARRDRLAELIAAPQITLQIALVGLLVAALLGAAHAFSPGHGKTIVGAYLVGSRGTPKHALFLGLTVTVTHTAGVILLGLLTLFASRFIMPERLFPILSFISGGMIVAIGLSLFVRRLRQALGFSAHQSHSHETDHPPEGLKRGHTHSHGGVEHSHLPPGADGPITWRSLLGLGISGGLLPCPSALVVLLAAISLGRIAYGLMLVVAFSVGLAATLSVVGLAFLYAGRFLKLSGGASSHPLVRAFSVLSSFAIACIGVIICYETLSASGIHLFSAGAVSAAPDANLGSMGAMAVLGLGLLFGLKHATEVDHVIAVSTIVSQHRNVLQSALVGGLWGLGHTASLVVVGTVVLAMRIAIPEGVARWLEFGVALMIIGLGANAFLRAYRGREGAHVHTHVHDDTAHSHLHFHENESPHETSVRPHSHAISRIGLKPLIVGAVHGLAGSAALTLLVLTQIGSALLGLLYLAVFGFGSIVGMLIMSGLVGLPFALTARKLTKFHHGLQATAGVFSIAFGLWYAYQTGSFLRFV